MTDQTGATVSFPWPGPECEGVVPVGRGRAKAKQTKVARDLKYRTHETDFGALANELHGQPPETDTSDALPDAELEHRSDYSQPRRDWPSLPACPDAPAVWERLSCWFH